MEGRKMIWGDLVMHDDDDTVDIVVSNVDLVDLLMRWGCWRYDGWLNWVDKCILCTQVGI